MRFLKHLSENKTWAFYLFKSDLQSILFIKFPNKWARGTAKILTMVLDASNKTPKDLAEVNPHESPEEEDCPSSPHLYCYSPVT